MTGFVVLGVFIVVYALIAARIEYLYITGPIVFVVVGFILGSGGTSVIDLGTGSEIVRVTASVTLSLLLFSDAATIRLRVLAQDAGMIARLLLIGLPLTIALGTGVAWLALPALGAGVCSALSCMDYRPAQSPPGTPPGSRSSRPTARSWRLLPRPLFDTGSRCRRHPAKRTNRGKGLLLGGLSASGFPLAAAAVFKQVTG